MCLGIKEYVGGYKFDFKELANIIDPHLKPTATLGVAGIKVDTLTQVPEEEHINEASLIHQFK